ncbi:anaerobic ribonucleoside-triphosphate reductase activating protein [Thiolapillus sp.]
MPHSSLRVGGFVPFTSIDYPGELAAVVFCQGCPWRCGYCHNRHLLPASSDHLLDWRDILKELEQRRDFLDAVVFSGGEPTTQSALAEAMEDVRALGYKVGLHTAGCHPRRLEKLLPLVDWIGLDIKALPEHYPAITGVAGSGGAAWESLECLRGTGIPVQIRTTLDPSLAPEQIRDIRTRIHEAGFHDHQLQPCRTP